jgi:hypothetical protein
MDQINVDQVDLGDNEFIRLGNSQDLTMVHTSTQSIINQAGIGDLLLQKAGATKLTINASGIDVTGSVTADGLSVIGDTGFNTGSPNAYAHIVPTDGELNDSFVGLRVSRSLSLKSAQYGTINQSGGSLTLNSTVTTGSASGSVRLLSSADGSTTKNLANFANNNDVSFYESTGTTPKLFWDASAENITINHEASSLNGLAIKNTTSSGVTTGAGLTLHAYDGSSTIQMGGMFVSNSTWSYGTYSPNQLNIGGSGSGGVRVATAVAPITFHTGNANAGLSVERMRIDASGNVIVGGSAQAEATSVTLNPQGYILAKSSHQPAAFFDRDNSDGEIVTFRKQGTPVGSIGAEGGDLTIGNADTGLQFVNTSQIIRPQNLTTNAAVDAQVSLGQSAYRFKDLYLSGGVYLGGTGAANKLEDYEEGTWTPVDGAGGVGSGGAGVYTKIGRLVHVSGTLVVTAFTGGNTDYAISGLPFTVSSATGAKGITMLSAGAAAQTPSAGICGAGGTTMYVRPSSAYSGVGISIYFSATYMT